MGWSPEQSCNLQGTGFKPGNVLGDAAMDDRPCTMTDQYRPVRPTAKKE
jgi:hypothetical protein